MRWLNISAFCLATMIMMMVMRICFSCSSLLITWSLGCMVQLFASIALSLPCPRARFVYEHVYDFHFFFSLHLSPSSPFDAQVAFKFHEIFISLKTISLDVITISMKYTINVSFLADLTSLRLYISYGCSCFRLDPLYNGYLWTWKKSSSVVR